MSKLLKCTDTKRIMPWLQIRPLRHVKIDTVLLPVSSRYIGGFDFQHCAVTGFPNFTFAFHIK